MFTLGTLAVYGLTQVAASGTSPKRSAASRDPHSNAPASAASSSPMTGNTTYSGSSTTDHNQAAQLSPAGPSELTTERSTVPVATALITVSPALAPDEPAASYPHSPTAHASNTPSSGASPEALASSLQHPTNSTLQSLWNLISGAATTPTTPTTSPRPPSPTPSPPPTPHPGDTPTAPATPAATVTDHPAVQQEATPAATAMPSTHPTPSEPQQATLLQLSHGGSSTDSLPLLPVTPEPPAVAAPAASSPAPFTTPASHSGGGGGAVLPAIAGMILQGRRQVQELLGEASGDSAEADYSSDAEAATSRGAGHRAAARGSGASRQQSKGSGGGSQSDDGDEYVLVDGKWGVPARRLGGAASAAGAAAGGRESRPAAAVPASLLPASVGGKESIKDGAQPSSGAGAGYLVEAPDQSTAAIAGSPVSSAASSASAISRPASSSEIQPASSLESAAGDGSGLLLLRTASSGQYHDASYSAPATMEGPPLAAFGTATATNRSAAEAASHISSAPAQLPIDHSTRARHAGVDSTKRRRSLVGGLLATAAGGLRIIGGGMRVVAAAGCSVVLAAGQLATELMTFPAAAVAGASAAVRVVFRQLADGVWATGQAVNKGINVLADGLVGLARGWESRSGVLAAVSGVLFDGAITCVALSAAARAARSHRKRLAGALVKV
jgi:hypothetical protein